MTRLPRPRRTRATPARLTTAVAVALAVTAGPLALTAPAVAEPVTATATAGQPSAPNENLPLYKHTWLGQAGETGYLASGSRDAYNELEWVRYADGAVTKLGSHDVLKPLGAASDIVALPDPATLTKVTLVDLSGGGAGVRTAIDLTTIGAGYKYAGLVGSTVIATNGTQVKFVNATGGTVTGRDVAGLPTDAGAPSVAAATKDTVLFHYEPGRYAAVELATASAAPTDVHTPSPGSAEHSGVVSADHIAWFETVAATKQSTLVVVDRATGETRRTSVPFASSYDLGLTRGWVVYGASYPAHSEEGPDYRAFAVPTGGGTPVKVLDRVEGFEEAPDGSLVVSGGLAGRGYGLFRVTGAPAGPLVEKIATTGRPTELAFVRSDIPAEVNLDQGRVRLSWELTRYEADYRLTLRHPASGIEHSVDLRPWAGNGHRDDPPYLDWDGSTGSAGNLVHGPSGTYEWSLTASPWDKIGPPVTASGSFVVKRSAAAHDWTDNGSPDVLATDSAGQLWREDSHFTPASASEHLVGTGRRQVGSGFGKYDRIESIGRQQGRAAFLGRDGAGDVWLHHDNGSGTPQAQGVKVGWGWQTYTHITGGGKQDDDANPDVVAVDTTGDLYVHPGTNTQPTAFAARKKVGWGWGIYNEVASVGDIAGTSFGDLVARDTAGVLWLYQGKADGSFEARVRIGGGWNIFTHLVGVGDGNRDGKADLYAYGPNGQASFYAGTGQAAQPFHPRSISTVLAGEPADYKVVF